MSDEHYCVVKHEVNCKILLFSDGIYPDWPIFVKPLHELAESDELRFTRRQKDIIKDVEHCIVVLNARFKIIRCENRR